jgi:hypothetical protein
MELFDLSPAPGQRLDAETHQAVFGDLPWRLASDLHTPEVGDLVLQLLDAGWRTGQLAVRVGAHPAGTDPAASVTALLRGFLDQVPPDARWREEKAQREAVRSSARFEEPASDASRQAWLAQIRSDLGVPRGRTREPVRRVRPACAMCGAESSFFVTKEVRLCTTCVEGLAGGGTTGATGVQQQLPDAG